MKWTDNKFLSHNDEKTGFAQFQTKLGSVWENIQCNKLECLSMSHQTNLGYLL
jgi:hypothetical protein